MSQNPSKMSTLTFPLRWESTGDKWWYASPIDFAAANNQYDLVRQLLRIDPNHLIQLTSLRRIRRLEAVWDDEKQFNDVAKHRCSVARQLFDECRYRKNGRCYNSLIDNGYGGWVLYTAASAGDVEFVKQLVNDHPLLVFGEGEFGLTDIFYAAARSKNCDVFRVVFDFAMNPRFGNEDGGQVGEVPMVFKEQVKNRAVLAAARGGNLEGLMELIEGCDDVLKFRDVNGSTLLHAAAGKGQVEVVKHLVATYDDMIASTDNEGNTPLHVAAYKGQLSVIDTLIRASPVSASVVNKAGNTYLQVVITGFQTPGFRRLDRQIELMKQLISTKCFNIEDIINVKNNQGRTALHLAIIGNIHSNLVELLMSARYINVNVRDDNGMTPLDYLKRQPRSASSDMLIRQLISVGGISSCKEDAMRKAFASHLKMQGICNSPGTSFRVPDNEIFLFTGMDHLLDHSLKRVKVGHLRSSSGLSQCESTNEDNNGPPDIKKSGPLHRAAKRLKTMLHWPLIKRKETERSKIGEDAFSDRRRSTSEETPISLREKFSNSIISSNKRTLEVRSNISSPTNRKKFALGTEHGVFHDPPFVSIPAHSPSSSFSRSSVSSSYNYLDKGKGICIEDEMTRPSCSKPIETPTLAQKQNSMRKSVNSILCFGGSHLSLKNSIGKHSIRRTVQSVA